MLSEIATGRKQTTVHGDQHSGVGRSRWRITIKDDDGRVLKEVGRAPDEATAISSASSAGGSPTVKAFEAAERRAVTVSGSVATHWSIIVRDNQDGIGSFGDHATFSDLLACRAVGGLPSAAVEEAELWWQQKRIPSSIACSGCTTASRA